MHGGRHRELTASKTTNLVTTNGTWVVTQTKHLTSAVGAAWHAGLCCKYSRVWAATNSILVCSATSLKRIGAKPLLSAREGTSSGLVRACVGRERREQRAQGAGSAGSSERREQGAQEAACAEHAHEALSRWRSRAAVQLLPKV